MTKGEYAVRNKAVLAGIVTYNPDLERLKLNLEAICIQVAETAIIDNGSQNIKDILSLIEGYDNVAVIENKNNRGIAVALNQIGDIADKQGYDYFITLDQDSVASSSLVEELYSLFKNGSIGAVCPYIDRKNDFIAEDKVEEVKTAITSGEMVRTSVWKEIGGFWEYLFIDEVDHEFSYQIRRKGYIIVQTYTVSIKHIIGVPSSKKVLGHQFNPTNHSAFRRYYIARNNVIMQHLFPKEKEPFPHRYIMLMRIVISILFCEKEKVAKIGAILIGIKDAAIWNSQNKTICVRRTER